MTFRELWEPYRRKYEKLRDETSSKRLLPYFGDIKLAGIAPEDIEDYILDRHNLAIISRPKRCIKYDADMLKNLCKATSFDYDTHDCTFNL